MRQTSAFLVGSHLLGLSNCHDVDYVVLVEGDETNYYRSENISGHDVFYRTVANLQSFLTFTQPFTIRTQLIYISNYQFDMHIIGPEFPVKYDLFKYRAQYIEMLNWVVDYQALNFNPCIDFGGWKCSKGIYHVAYLTFILENGSTTLTSEQKAIVQQIHDGEMPVEYLDVLKSKIKALR